MCLYPRLVRNKKYTPNKKNKGNVPIPSDTRVLVVPRGCGRCMECRKKKKREWQVRLSEEVKEKQNGHYVTLTFSNEAIQKLTQKYKEIDDQKGYDWDNAIATKAVRLFTERWRKEYGTHPRHWLITELGQTNTERIHLHGIIWTNEKREKIKQHWQYGHIDNREHTYISDRTVNYIIKYITKNDPIHKNYIPKILCSNGIGRNYTNTTNPIQNKYKENETNETYKTQTGHKIALPIYYRNKIYSETEREQLWIEKLNQQKRYINGREIDISKGEEIYKQALKEAQQKNRELGYGTDEDWRLKKYEDERRMYLRSEITKEVFKGELPIEATPKVDTLRPGRPFSNMEEQGYENQRINEILKIK